IANFLENHPKVKSVRYPGLPSHPGYQLAQSQMQEMGSTISFELKSEFSISAKKFCHELQLIQLAVSIGATETIICPTQDFFGLDLSETDRSEMGLNSFSLRLSVG